jgi:chorismate mutase/prephenate dehydratase
MQEYRDKIDIIDDKLLSLLKERFDIAKSIAQIKKNDTNIVLYDPVREKNILNNLKSKKMVDDIIVDQIWNEILYLSRCIQKDIYLEIIVV